MMWTSSGWSLKRKTSIFTQAQLIDPTIVTINLNQYTGRNPKTKDQNKAKLMISKPIKIRDHQEINQMFRQVETWVEWRF